jgi:hypothetical protein
MPLVNGERMDIRRRAFSLGERYDDFDSILPEPVE